jgi:O-antigen ligase
MASEVTVNPHNQTFAIGIQLGVMGTLALWAMWIAHFLLFRSGGITAWLGTVIVVDNVVCSTVHSRFIPAQTHPC